MSNFYFESKQEEDDGGWYAVGLIWVLILIVLFFGHFSGVEILKNIFTFLFTGATPYLIGFSALLIFLYKNYWADYKYTNVIAYVLKYGLYYITKDGFIKSTLLVLNILFPVVFFLYLGEDSYNKIGFMLSSWFVFFITTFAFICLYDFKGSKEKPSLKTNISLEEKYFEKTGFIPNFDKVFNFNDFSICRIDFYPPNEKIKYYYIYKESGEIKGIIYSTKDKTESEFESLVNLFEKVLEKIHYNCI